MKIMAKKINGRVIDKKTRLGLHNIRIDVWDKSSAEAIQLATAVTDLEGRFMIQIDSGAATVKSGIIFKLYSGDQLLQSIPLTDLQNSNKTEQFIIPVELPSPGVPGEKWQVTGLVTKANGQPVNVQVNAVNIKLNNRQFLGQVQTEHGAYKISYLPDAGMPGCDLPDLLVEATLNDVVVATSPVFYNAGQIATVNLVVGNSIYKGPSEYQLLETSLKQCLGDMDPAILNSGQVEYLSNKTGNSTIRISLYVLAFRQAKATGAVPPLFYACFRKQLPYSLDKLIRLQPKITRSRIESAIDENIIDEEWKAQVDGFIESLKNYAINSALAIDTSSTKSSLGKVFTQINIPAASQAPLLNLYAKHQDDTPAFWKALRENKLLKQYEAPLRLVLKVSALTQHFEPATKAIMEHPVIVQGADISSLAKLSSNDWKQVANSIGAAPETIPGKEEEQLQNYALLMEKTIMSAFPTQHVSANIIKSGLYQNTELPKFFEAAPDFSFEGANIQSYVNKMNGQITDKAAVIKDLTKLQRLYYLAPAHSRYPAMEVLDKEGMGSALQIRQYGKNAFLNIFGKKLGSKNLASAIFSKASYISTTTMSLAMQYNDLNGGALPYVLQGQTGTNKMPGELELPDLGSLFGAQSFCSCTHCRSVYSAAAYFTDLLSYLKEHYEINNALSTDENIVYVEKSPGVFVNGLDLLFNRRSDLGEILLNCENTNTLIPYLDIVLEVLENAVLNTPEAYQTTSTSDELKANPEHIKTAVYDDYLAIEIFPFTQPFNLWNEEANVYLEHLGVRRYELMDSFQFRGAANEPDNLSKYAVQLYLTVNGKDIITGKSVIGATTYTTKDFWGVTEIKWIEILSNVQTFIEKAGISFVQLLEFLQLNFVNATGMIKVKFAPGAPCDISQAVLAYWDEATQSFTGSPLLEKVFIRAHCFFRLLLKTPWTIFELGRIMDSLGTQNITDRFIEQAAILQQLHGRFKKDPLELVSWWAGLNTQSDQNNPDDRSFYARHFLNKTVFDPQEINEENFVFTLNEDQTDLKNTGNLISENLNEIEAALNISSSDLLLLTGTLLNLNGETDDTLTLKNLSQLFRIVSLTSTLHISVNDYLVAAGFIIPDPFSAADPAGLLSFIEQVDQVKRSGFNFAELQYLLLGQYNSSENIAPTEDRITVLFIALQAGLVKIKSEQEVPLDENGIPVDPNGDLCRQKLFLLLEEDGIGKVVAIVEATAGLSPQQEIDAVALLNFLDAALLLLDFATPAYNTIEARYAYILQRLTGFLVDTQSRSFIIQALSSDLSVNLDIADLLLTSLVYSTAAVHDPINPVFAIEDFLDPLFAYDELEAGELFDPGKFPVLQNTFVVIHKSALFINKFSLGTEEVNRAFAIGSGIGWPDLNNLAGTATVVFLSWLKMENFFYLRGQFTEGDTSFFDLMDYAAEPSLIDSLDTGYEASVDAFIAGSVVWTAADKNFLVFLSLLSGITGWETGSLFFLASKEAYTLRFNDFTDEQAFYQLMKCFDILNILAASASDAWDWMAVDLAMENSGNIKQTAKAKYSETEWLEVAAPLRDVLREKQRDALTAYLVQNRGFGDADALYEYYLMDVETSACTMSSRIVLANSAVQLFIQRHLMNLEIETLDLDAERWEWMKNYRVWEANRKVFLYPENWIEPELRLIKSGFFTDLQNDLLQNDVTAGLVENSMKDYLGKLDEVSNIEVCGTYHQNEAGEGTPEEISDTAIDVLHVFGKTIGIPNEYYYRTYVDNSYWSPWEKVDLAIEGKHLVPVILNKRLHLFWAEFTEKQEEVSETNMMTYWEIRVAYSEYKNGSWQAKKSFEEFIESDKLNVALALEAGSLNFSNYGLYNFSFLTINYGSFLEIKCIQVIDTGLATNDQYREGRFYFYYDTKKVIADNDIPVLLGLDTLIKPAGTEMDYIAFKETGSAALELVKAEVDENGNYLGNEDCIRVLDITPGTFRIPFMHQYNEFVSQDNFFYGDDYRNFFVKPSNAAGNLMEVMDSVSSTDATTPLLDHYLNEADIAVGIFNETLYDTRGVEAVIFDTGPKDRLDPLPPPGLHKHRPVLEEIQSDNGKAYTRKIMIPGKSIVDQNFTNQQVNQLQYLGDTIYRFYDFYHPCVIDFIKTLNVSGVEKLITRKTQQQTLTYFSATYLPTENVSSLYPLKEVDFSPGGAMSLYNWELFFHVPMLVAGRLSSNQQFEEAQKWYHFIFNPLDRSSEASPNKFWQFKPFFELYGAGEGAAEDSIYNLMYALSYSGTDINTLNKKAEAELQVEAWLVSPFDPHVIASLRPVAYMKSIVMKYIDNLVAWGDFKFQQDTVESINEATQLYILAAQILGKRPELIPVEETEARSYNDLVNESGTLDVFSNALVTLENVYSSGSLTVSSPGAGEILPKSLYFCIPNNPNLLAYWDTVEDRLFKIRHCMNIEGQVRQLPLFQPPIDPGLLVKARAAGLSIGSVLNDLYAPLPQYRYRVMVQKALEFCADVKALGNALLNILEKKDAEEMALLRAGHELKILQVMAGTKSMQLDESRENLDVLKKMRKITEDRHNYYAVIEKINTKEQLYLDKLEDSRREQKLAEKNELRAARMNNIPNFSATVSLPPSVSTSFGGANLGAIASAYAAGHRNKSAQFAYQANKASILAGYNRRWDEWKLQEKSAAGELIHIDKQITAAEIRVAIMEKEIDTQNRQIENSQEISGFMTGKFTNKELYEWMTGQLATLYFQSYQMAYDLAKRAQKSLQYELATDQSFIAFGYWDSLKKGLLAGDKLHYDIRRMELAFLDQNKRTYELTKSVSLTMLDPMAMVQLRETGTCFINLPEVLFDLDHAGHYMRRIRSVELTMPCVTGPYTSVSCKLTLLDNKWRKDISGDDYRESTDDFDSRFIYNSGGTQSVATSSGQNDSGLFQLNYNDERYLPFEGAGAISSWQVQLPFQLRSFDYNTLTDVIIRLSYTSREGGELLKSKATDALQQALMTMELGSDNAGLTRMFSLKHEFANEWYRFLNPPAEQSGQQVAIELDSSRFPFMFRKLDLTVTRAEVILIVDDTGQAEKLPISITAPSLNTTIAELDINTTIGGQLYGEIEPLSAKTGLWQIAVEEAAIPAGLSITVGSHTRLNTAVVKNILLILSYTTGV